MGRIAKNDSIMCKHNKRRIICDLCTADRILMGSRKKILKLLRVIDCALSMVRNPLWRNQYTEEVFLVRALEKCGYDTNPYQITPEE